MHNINMYTIMHTSHMHNTYVALTYEPPWHPFCRSQMQFHAFFFPYRARLSHVLVARCLRVPLLCMCVCMYACVRMCIYICGLLYAALSHVLVARCLRDPPSVCMHLYAYVSICRCAHVGNSDCDIICSGIRRLSLASCSRVSLYIWCVCANVHVCMFVCMYVSKQK